MRCWRMPGMSFPLPAEGFSPHPVKALRFGAQFLKSYYFAKQILLGVR